LSTEPKLGESVSATPEDGCPKRYPNISEESGMVVWHIIVLTVIDISSIGSAILERQSITFNGRPVVSARQM
jgi:hypothetical protein